MVTNPRITEWPNAGNCKITPFSDAVRKNKCDGCREEKIFLNFLLDKSHFITGGCISYNNAQQGTQPYMSASEINKNGSRPAILNNGNLTLDGTSLRAGSKASYVLKNNGIAKLTGGGSLQGGARKNSTSALVVNGSGNTLNISLYVLNASFIITDTSIKVGTAILNSGKCDIYGNGWNAVGNANIGINNSGTCTINSTQLLISGCQKGIYNTNTLACKNGNVTTNDVGIENKGNCNISSGQIYNNIGYGINNTGTVIQSGGSIYGNNGAKPDSSDTVSVGVYQGNVYTVSGSTSIYNNSLYLPSTSSRLKQSGMLTGSVMLTTATSDRQIGRELVTGNSSNYSNYYLAYGNVGSKTNARYVKDAIEEGGGAFSGNKAGVRPGNLIYNKIASSCYLSGEYNISYLPNTPPGDKASPISRPNTTFYYRENVNALFGANIYTATKNEFKGYARSAFSTIPEYTSNYFFRGVNAFSGNKTYYGVWEEITEDDKDRTIVYKPNGAVDQNGILCGDVRVNKPAPLSEPVSLLDGTYAGGIRLGKDITYTKGDVRYDLSEYVPPNTGVNSIQYRAKAGDIVNNLGNTTTLSKFRGWSITSDNKNAFNGNVTLTSDSLWGKSAKDIDDFVFYAAWDEFPQLVAGDIVVNSNYVSKEDLTKNIVASDREDGDITGKVQIINYNEVLNALPSSNGFTVIYEVADSAGNTTRAFAKIKIDDKYDGKALNVIPKQIRCINRHAYNTCNVSEGGCLPNSPFYTEAEYATVLISCFDNLDNNTPIARYTLTRNERQDISNHMHEVGLEHMYDKNVLQFYVDNYMDAEHQNRRNEYSDSKLLFYRISSEQMLEREEKELDRLKALRNNMDLTRVYL